MKADDGQPTCGEIITDASAGVVSAEAGDEVRGYAAYGRSIRSAIEPLVESFGIELFDDGERLRLPDPIEPLEISEIEFGNSVDGDTMPRFDRELVPARAVQSSISLTFYDPARDYQTGEAKASVGEKGRGQAQFELPAALSAGDAKSLAQRMLARTWSDRDKLTLRLPRQRIALQPGATVELPFSPGRWTVDQITIEGFVPVIQLRPTTEALAAVAGESGLIVPNLDVVAGPITLTLLDIPALPGTPPNQPTILLAASQSRSGWKARSLEISFGGQSIATQTARGKSILGNATTALSGGSAHLLDEINSVEVALVDQDQWLTSCDNDALAAGTNLAVLGREVLQFGTATSLGGGKFRLSRLLRGRGGTEWAQADHAIGEAFCLLKPGAFRPVALPTWMIGAEVRATMAGSEAARLFTGETLRPLSPVNLRAEFAGGELRLRWTRRSRAGLAWIDGVDVPLGESSERYLVRITGPVGSIEIPVATPELVVDASAMASVGMGTVAIQVIQVGDFASSRPEKLEIFIA